MDSYRGKKKMDKSLLSYFNESLNKVVETDDDYKSLRLKKLEECLQLLPKRCQLVFLEKKVSGLKNKEIASNLNISLKTVEGHVARGYKFLKDCIKASSNSF